MSRVKLLGADTTNNFPSPIKLPFAYRRRERPITLYRGPLELRDDCANIAAGDGEVFFRWLPSPGGAFVIPDQQLFGFEGQTHLYVPALGVDASVMLTSWSPSGGDVRGAINRAPFPATEAIRELRFAVANYLCMNRAEPLAQVSQNQKTYWAGRTALEADGFVLTLDARPDATSVKDRLKAKSGYEVTHTARLKRTDDATFSDRDASDKLVALTHVFGLTRGLWAPPLLAQGYDERGRIVWRDWSPPSVSPWRGVMNVIDVFHPEALQEVFAGFLHSWAQPIWHEPLIYATQMYVEANGPVYAETSLVLAQAALELIAWVYVVQEEKSESAAEFAKTKYGAAGRMRKLLNWLEVDPAIPARLSALTAEADRLNWIDGPHAIAELRNALSHPDKRHRIEDSDLGARLDLHELALWYVELALLRVVGFGGNYSSRLDSHTSGVVVPVPWA